MMEVLAAYDCFLENHNIREDYCNTRGIEVYDEESGEWNDWVDEESGEDDPDVFIEDHPEKFEWLKSLRESVFSQVDFS